VVFFSFSDKCRYLHTFNWKTKCKGKVAPVLYWISLHEDVLGNGGIAPRINLGTRWRWVVSLTPLPLYPRGKSSWYPLDRRLGGPQSRPGRGGKEKNSQPPSAIEPWNPDRPVRSPALYRLNYHGSCLVAMLKIILYAMNLILWNCLPFFRVLIGPRASYINLCWYVAGYEQFINFFWGSWHTTWRIQIKWPGVYIFIRDTRKLNTFALMSPCNKSLELLETANPYHSVGL
jgi:hypothetical protein